MADSRLVVTVTETGSDKVNRKLKDVGKTGKSVEKQTESMSDRFKQFGSSASQAVAAVDGPLGGVSSRISSITQLLSSGPTGLVGATAAAASAFTALSVATANQVRELSTLSQLAGQTTHEFQAMTHVASQFGLTDISDKFKDVKERVGEFVATGGGGLQDFADVMGMTTDQTLALAREMENLTGEQVLKKLVSDMEAAGVSTSQMSFALEGVASDLTVLIPSLRDGASEFDRLKQNAENFTSPLTDKQISDYRNLAENVDLVSLSFESLIQNSLSPAIKFVSDLAAEWAHLLATFNAGTIPNITSQMADVSDEIKDVKQQIANLDDGVSIFEALDPTQGKDAEFLKSQLKDLESQYASLQEQYKQASGLTLPERPDSTAKTIESGDEKRNWQTDDEKKAESAERASQRAIEAENRRKEAEQNRINAQIEQMKLSMMTEQELFEKKEQWIIDNVANETEQFELLTALNDEYTAKKSEALKKQMEDEERAASRKKQTEERERKTKLGYLDQSTEDMKTAFGEQSGIYKAAAIANTTVKTYESATGAYAALSSIPYVGPALGAAAAGAAIAAGMANIAAIKSARMQGGDLSPGVPTLVGERGPEIITSRGNGKVIPNNKLGGGGSVNISVINQGEPVKMSMRSDSTDETGMRQIVMEMVPDIVSRLAGDPDSDLNVNQQRLYPTARGF